MSASGKRLLASVSIFLTVSTQTSLFPKVLVGSNQASHLYLLSLPKTKLCPLIPTLLCAASLHPQPQPQFLSDALPLCHSLRALWNPGSMANKCTPSVTAQKALFTSFLHGDCGSHLRTQLLWPFQGRGLIPYFPQNPGRKAWHASLSLLLLSKPYFSTDKHSTLESLCILTLSLSFPCPFSQYAFSPSEASFHHKLSGTL